MLHCTTASNVIYLCALRIRSGRPAPKLKPRIAPVPDVMPPSGIVTISIKLCTIVVQVKSDTKDGDGECYLLRDTSKPEDAEAAYEFVDDDGELEYMSKVFAELMSDLGVDIE